MNRFIVLLVLGLTASLIGAPATQAGDAECSGPLTVESVSAPSHRGCILDDIQVMGDVVAGPGSYLFLNGANVEGDVRCDRCRYAGIVDSTVEGSVQMTGLREGAFVGDNVIGGNLQITDSTDEEASIGSGYGIYGNEIGGGVNFANNRGPADFIDNVIAGDLVVFKSSAGLFNNLVGGDVLFIRNRDYLPIFDNQIQGNLECRGNEPAPFGEGNTAAAVFGQCRDMSAEPPLT